MKDLRQFAQPEAFRIPANVDDSSLDALGQSIESISAAVEQLSATAGAGVADDVEFVAELATRAWRIKSTIDLASGEDDSKKHRRIGRHIGRIIETLGERDIRIVDDTNEVYDAGMITEVIAAEPMSGITRRTIKETVRPAVYLNSELIQTSQIVVGTPKNDTD